MRTLLELIWTQRGTRIAVLTLLALGACQGLAHAVPGLDERPANPTCEAPDRPLPDFAIELERVFPDHLFDLPILMRPSPVELDIFYIAELPGRLIRVDASTDPAQVTTMLDHSASVIRGGEAGLLGFDFHPDFASNGEVYVYYTGVGGPWFTSIFSRFTSSDGGLTLDPASEDKLLEVEQPGAVHQGGMIEFGPDGFLYIGFGDGGGRKRGQQTNNMFGAVLRIDVDAPGVPYGIPADNPFAQGGGAPEIYAWGLRNPWRITFDRLTHELWAGDVGLASYEEVNRIERGKNYGWAIREGAHCFRDEPCDPTGLTDPYYEYSHDEGCAIIGGYVYRGSAIPELEGAYVYGDFCLSGVLALLDDGAGNPEPHTLGATGFRLHSLSEDADGELYALIDDSIYRLVPGDAPTGDPFPQKLSETGCVDSQDPTQPVPGLIPYDLNVPFWSDGAAKTRWLGLPDGEQIEVGADGDWDFPIGTVLMKEFRLGGRRVETRIFARHQDSRWGGYSYAWDEAETDASLVDGALAREVEGQTWFHPSGVQCLQCHTAEAGGSLGLETAQMNRDLTYPATGRTANQIETFDSIGLFASAQGDPGVLPVLPDTGDPDALLDQRARAYLHANCSHCHRPGTPVQAQLDLRASTPWPEIGACDVQPIHDLEIPDVRLLTPGIPALSAMSLRMHALDDIRMPPIGQLVVDAEGAALVDEWITSWPSGCVGPDSDFDAEPDDADNCPGDANPSQGDADQDGVGDACDPDCISGDTVCDGRVNILDVQRVLNIFGASTGDPDFDPELDLVADGTIDILDVQAVLNHFGETSASSPSPPSASGPACNLGAEAVLLLPLLGALRRLRRRRGQVASRPDGPEHT